MTKMKIRKMRISTSQMRDVKMSFSIVAPAEYQHLKFEVENISQQGMFLTVPELPPVGIELFFKLEFKHLSEALEGKALVVRHELEDRNEFERRGVGIVFTALSERAMDIYSHVYEINLLNLKVQDIMATRVVTITAETTIFEATHLMNKSSIGSILIVDNNQQLSGIYTERDHLHLPAEVDVKKTPIGKFMTKNPNTMEYDTPIDQMSDLVSISKYRHWPITKEGRLVGMLSIRDIIPFWREISDVKLNRLKRDRDRAMGLIVHDLRTPLGSIKSANALLKDSILTPEQFAAEGMPEMIDTQCDNLLRMVHDLLEFTTFYESNISLNKAEIRASSLIKHIVKEFENPARKKGLNIIFSGDTDIVIKADAMRIEQVFQNLISNAVKYSSSGSVRVEVKNEKGRFFARVSDTGQGIAAEKIERLFEPFSNIGSVPTANERSTGLGLAVVKKIVTAHQGYIDVQSELGKGTTFTISLPVN